MTVSASTRKAGPFTGNGVQTTFPFTFKVFTSADISVLTAVTATTVETALVLDSDYSVALNADQDASPGGTITYPISGTALPASKTLTAIGALVYKQATDVPSGGDFNADSIENALDYQNILIQQLLESDSRSVKVTANSTTDPDDLVADLFAAELAAVAAAAAAAASAATTAGLLDTFDDIFLGAKAANPTLDNDGNALQTGALYFNTAIFEMRVYNGTTWQAAGTTVNGTSKRQSFTATAGQTVFSVAGGYDAGFADVYLNGAKLVNGTDVVVTSGTDVVLASGATVGDSVDVVAFGTFLVANSVAKNGDTMTGALILSANATAALGAVTKQQYETAASLTASGIVELATTAEAQTGTDAMRAVTPAGLGAVALGVGQLWQDVKASRALSTVYTNSTGRAIMISVAAFPAGSALLQFTINGVVACTTQAAAGLDAGLTAVVPPGASYSVTMTGGTLDYWAELR